MASRGRIPNNSTTISLHERFSKLRSSAGGQKLAGKAQGRRQNIAEVQKQSRQTNRLNQQMERRATVNAALKLKKKTIKQRLGSTQPSFTPSTKVRGGGALTARRGGRGNAQTARKQAVKAIRGGVTIKSQTIVRGGGTPKRGRSKPNSSAQQVTTTPTRNKSPVKNRGAVRGRGRGGQQRTPQAPTSGAKKPQRGGKSPRANSNRGGNTVRGGKRGGRGGAQAPKMTKEDLDKQLDQYMSKTRQGLDKELENYMSITGDVDMN